MESAQQSPRQVAQQSLGVGSPPLASTGATSLPSETPSHEPSILDRLKRTASIVKHHLPFTSSSASGAHSSSNDANPYPEGAPETAGPRAWSIAPVSHRENSAKRALYDSMPSLPSLPSIDSLLSHPFLTSYNASTPVSRSRSTNSKPQKSISQRRCFSSSASTAMPTASPFRSRSNPCTPALSDESDHDDDDDEEEEEDDREEDELENNDHTRLNLPRGVERPDRARSLSRDSRRQSDSAPSPNKDPLNALYGNVVMTGGFRGSVLRDPVADQRIWIPMKVPAGLRKVTLALGLTEQDENSSRDRIVGTKMLTHVGPLDMGKSLKHLFTSIRHSQKAALRGSRLSIPFMPHGSSTPSAETEAKREERLLRPPIKVESWGYDFRLSLQTPSKELVERLTRLKQESRARGEGPNGQGLGAVVICHSMGGLVVLHALAQASDPTIFRGIVFAGTPFQGCVNVLGPLALDQGFRRNPGVGSPEVVFSWRSVFYFLPRGEPYSVGAIEEDEESNDASTNPAARASARPDQVASPVPSTTTTTSWTSPSTWSSPFSSNSNATTTTTTTASSTSIDSNGSSSELTWQSHTKPPLEALFHGCFEDHAGRPIPIHFHDPHSWSKYCLSPLTAGLYGPTITGDTIDRRLVHEKARGSKVAGGGGGTTMAESRRGSQGVQGDLSSTLPLPGAPGTMGDEMGISRNGIVGKAVEAGQEAVDHLNESPEDAEFVDEQITEDDVIRQYLERSLQRSLQFWSEIDNSYDPSKAHLYPPCAVITNSKIPTVRGVQVKNRQTIPIEKYDSLLYAGGDGIVTYDSAITLPGPWANLLRGVVETSHGHVAMLADISTVRKAIGLLELS
ncbi:uncharacterized protein JCM15063_002439 [Sporobolomyces koalae]|uniref:uncharacterized protein n=1 Tax=Sporobolomyces koalae TaxID=500713 RepID=UPI0031779DD1